MKCEFCREEIDAKALICPHCRKKTAEGRAKGRDRAAWTAFWIVGVLVGLFVLAVMAGRNIHPEDDRIARIDAGCEREFAGNTSAVTNCKTALYVQELDKQEADKLKRAAGGF